MNKLVKVKQSYPAVITPVKSAASGKASRLKNAALHFVSEGRQTMFICAAFIAAGFAVGAAVYAGMETDSKNIIFTYMQNYFIGSVIIGASPMEIFTSCVTGEIITGLIIAVCAVMPFLFPFCFVRMGAKGFSMGFSTAFLISRYGAKGIAFALVSVGLCNIISLSAAVWFIMAARSVRRETPMPAKSGRRKISPVTYGIRLSRILACLGVFLAAALVSAAFESIIGHGLLRGLYGILSAFS